METFKHLLEDWKLKTGKQKQIPVSGIQANNSALGGISVGVRGSMLRARLLLPTLEYFRAKPQGSSSGSGDLHCDTENKRQRGLLWRQEADTGSFRGGVFP